MDKRVYILTIVSFVVGMVELIIGGILDLVATDLNVSDGQAGLLITIFSLVFAIAAPILLILTSSIERKRLTLIFLIIFLLGNIVAVLSTTYSILMVARIISAASGSLLVVLCITIASSIVEEKYIGRAIGIVIMGISASLVMGVPIGVVLGHNFGWRAPFLLITILTFLLIIGIYYFMQPVEAQPSVSMKKQLATLKDSKILFAQLTTFLFLAGHFTFYAFFTPFLTTNLNLNGTWISIIYFIFGIAAVSGGGVGGLLSDRFGSKPVLIAVNILFALSLFIIPYSTTPMILFIVVVMFWGMMSWVITPALQSYLIDISPETAAIQQTLNNSALHFGIAFGSFIGSFVIDRASVNVNAIIGGCLVILALLSITFSITRQQKNLISLPTE